MKRLSKLLQTFGLAIGIGLTGTGCKNNSTTVAQVSIPGTNDMVVAGDALYIVSTDLSELKVLNLQQTANPRDFLRAPNPIDPLSIPVIDHPVGLAVDTRFDAGQEVGGPYVYAHANGSSIVSVVVASREASREVHRLQLPAPVTALAARGPSASRPESTLYFATSSGADSAVWEVRLPPPPNLAMDTVVALPAAPFATFPQQTVQSMLVMPDEDALVVARRPLGAMTGNETQEINPNNAGAVRRTLQFPWPVLRLATHGETDGRAAGNRVFGVLDSGACPAERWRECHGVVAVEADGTLARDVSVGTEPRPAMIPVSVAQLPLDDTTSQSGLDEQITGLTVAARAPLRLSSDTNVQPVTFRLLGIASTSAGRIFFFDGEGLRHVDYHPEPPLADTFQGLATDGTTVRADLVGGPDPATLVLGDGAVQTERVTVTFQGVIPGLDLIEQTSPAPDNVRFAVPSNLLLANSALLSPRAGVGDVLTFAAVGGVPAACTTERAVVAVELPGTLVVDAPLPPECAGVRLLYSVHAGAALPYVVRGSVGGYYGRAAPGQAFQYAGPFYHHPTGFTPGAIALGFSMRPADPQIQRGEGYGFSVNARFQPINTSIGLTDASYTVASSTIYTSGWDRSAARVFTAFPSADSVVSFQPSAIVPGTASGTDRVQTYR